MQVKSALFLTLILYPIWIYSQSSSGCADNLIYNIDFNDNLVKEIKVPGSLSVFEVSKLDTIIIHARAGHPSCNFFLYPLYFNDTIDSSALISSYGYFGDIKFKARQGKYSVKVRTGSSENTISFYIKVYRIGTQFYNGVAESFNRSKSINHLGPNPFKDILTLTFNSSVTPEKIVIFNSQSQQVFFQRKPKEELNINLGHLPSGMYMVRYIYPDKSESFKVIKN